MSSLYLMLDMAGIHEWWWGPCRWMKAELVTILGEAGRPGIFLSVKIREDTAGPVLLLLEWWKDATYRDLTSNRSLLAKQKVLNFIHVSRSSCEFLPHMSSGFPLTLSSLPLSLYFFVNSSVLSSFSVTASLPHFPINIPCNRWVPSFHPELL